MAQQIDAQKLMEQVDRLPMGARCGVYGAVSALVVLLYFFTLHGSTRAALHTAEQQLGKLHQEIAEARNITDNLEAFRARGEELAAQLRYAQERLPKQREMPVLLTDISSLGKKSGLEIRGFDPADKEIDHGFYAEVPINLEFTGKYHETGMFLERLARLSRIVNVTELSMKVENDRDAEPELLFTGIATTFRFLEEREQAPAGRGAPGRAPARGQKGT
jgi:type IV pilus assembly protein PilO